MSMPHTSLAGIQVGQMGFGLMRLTWVPRPPPQEESFAAMKAAADAGCTAWSTAMFYGNFLEGEERLLDNIRLIGAFFKKYPEYKDKITLIIKGCVTHEWGITLDLDHWRKQLKETKEILGDKRLDIVSCSRIPPGKTPEDVAHMLKTLKDEGWYDHAGISEVNATSLDKMNKIVPIVVNEIEVSLFSNDQVVREVIDYAGKNNIAILAYSPLGRGFLTRKWKSPEDIPDDEMIKKYPRFQNDAFYENLKLVDVMDEIAAKKGVKTSQLALAWVLQLGKHVIPIPGSSDPERIRENAAAASITLTDEDLKSINEILDKFETKGGRYPDHGPDILMK